MAAGFGKKLNISVFGSSHGEAVGTTVTGLPAGIVVDMQQLQAFMDRRAPGRSALSTARREADVPIFETGLTEGVTNGQPLTVTIANTNARRTDYDALRGIPRPGHADYTAWVKYGANCDMAGGGQFSGRMTAPVCAVGGILLQLLAEKGIAVSAHILQIADVRDSAFHPLQPETEVNRKAFPVLCSEAGEQMQQAVLAAKQRGDSVGGIIECAVTGLPAGVGGALFEGMESRIAAALFAVPAVKGVEFGAGFAAAAMCGSEHNDAFIVENGCVKTSSNHAGGILGGITNGMPLIFRCAVKPTPSIALPQQSVQLQNLQPCTVSVGGRHDACIVPRAVPVVEAVAAIAVCDAMAEENML
ncbi:MAG: chorismate synthase [Oscillospiraceae bacterium]|nr:chorismate synthase [Oscillospiraceae bacterium]